MMRTQVTANRLSRAVLVLRAGGAMQSGAVITPAGIVLVESSPSATIYRVAFGGREYLRTDVHTGGHLPPSAARMARVAYRFAKRYGRNGPAFGAQLDLLAAKT